MMAIPKLSEIHQRIDKLESRLSSQKSRLDWTQGFIISILAICFLAFLGFLYDYFNFTSDQRQRLYDKLEQLEKDNQNRDIKKLKGQVEYEGKLQTPLDTIIK